MEFQPQSRLVADLSGDSSVHLCPSTLTVVFYPLKRDFSCLVCRKVVVVLVSVWIVHPAAGGVFALLCFDFFFFSVRFCSSIPTSISLLHAETPWMIDFQTFWRLDSSLVLVGEDIHPYIQRTYSVHTSYISPCTALVGNQVRPSTWKVPDPFPCETRKAISMEIIVQDIKFGRSHRCTE